MEEQNSKDVMIVTADSKVVGAYIMVVGCGTKGTYTTGLTVSAGTRGINIVTYGDMMLTLTRVVLALTLPRMVLHRYEEYWQPVKRH